MPPDEACRNHGYQGQRDKARDDDGTRQDHAELTKQESGGAGQEGDRHENRNQDCRRCHHRKKHLACAYDSSCTGTHATRVLSLNIFENDDGIIDDQSGCKYQRKQCQDIDGETKQPDRRDRADQ